MIAPLIPDAFKGIVFRTRAILVLGALALVVGLTPPRAERYGDHIQIALPLLALGCEIANGSGLEYAGRFVVLQSGILGSKAILGDHPVNQRPNGRGEGFPSGHTAAAVFGAASLVDSCLLRNPVARMAVISAAGFVGASRIEADKHTIWQVLAGVVWGLGCNCALRRNGPARSTATRILHGTGRGILRGLRWSVMAAAAGLRAAFDRSGIAVSLGPVRYAGVPMGFAGQAGDDTTIGRSRTGR